MIVAGVGFRATCTAEELAGLVRAVLAGRTATVLAAPAFKAGAPALEAAALLGLSLVLVDDPALAAVQPLCPTRSDPARRATGHDSIAEACALAAAGRGARLLGPRTAAAMATCAVAVA